MLQKSNKYAIIEEKVKTFRKAVKYQKKKQKKLLKIVILRQVILEHLAT